MNEFKTTIDNHGRIVIPAKCRDALHVRYGDTIIIRIIGADIQISSAKTTLERAQKIVTQAMKGKKGLVEELIKNRRQEADE